MVPEIEQIAKLAAKANHWVQVGLHLCFSLIAPTGELQLGWSAVCFTVCSTIHFYADNILTPNNRTMGSKWLKYCIGYCRRMCADAELIFLLLFPNVLYLCVSEM